MRLGAAPARARGDLHRGGRPIIIGRDTESGAVALTWGIDPVRGQEHAKRGGIYALLPEAPFARRLPEGNRDYLARRELRWAGEPVQARFLGWVPTNALQLGDLVVEDARDQSADGVAGIHAGAVIVGDRRIALPEDLPVIGQTEFLQRYRPVE